MMKTTLFEVAGAFNKAYCRGGLRRTNNSRVSGTGIYPLNSHIFSAEDFLVPEMLQESSKTVSAEEKSNYR
jgi:hypothetical protein